MSYVVGERTAARLREVLRKVPGQGGGFTHFAGGRRTCFVIVTDVVNGDGFYPCQATNYVTEEDDWETFDDALAIEANGEALTVGKRYEAIRAGDSEDGDLVFVTTGACCPGPLTGYDVGTSLGSGVGSLPFPAITLTDETLLLFSCQVDVAGASYDAHVSTPTNWTPIARGSVQSGFAADFALFGRVWRTGDATTGDVTLTGPDAVTATNLCVSVHGAFMPVVSASASGNSNSVNAPAIVVPEDDSTVLVFIQGDGSGGANVTAAADYSLIGVGSPVIGSGSAIAYKRQGVKAGLITAPAFPVDRALAWSAVTVSLSPGVPPNPNDPESGIGPPSNSIGHYGSIYFDVTDPLNPQFYYKT